MSASRDAIVAIIDEMDAAGEWDERLERDRASSVTSSMKCTAWDRSRSSRG